MKHYTITPRKFTRVNYCMTNVLAVLLLNSVQCDDDAVCHTIENGNNLRINDVKLKEIQNGQQYRNYFCISILRLS